jgi:tRNA 5-methylaminomethyl-2-thiouridine biosynthesis bifunctional protein
MKISPVNVINTQVIVLGAGVAGATIAGEIQRRGHQVLIIDQHEKAAQENSAHQMALAHPMLGRKPTKLQRFTQCANQIAYAQWSGARLQEKAFEPRPSLNYSEVMDLKSHVTEMGFTDAELLVLHQEEARLRLNINTPGIVYETAGIYSLPMICQLELQGVQSVWNCEITKIQKTQEGWQVFNNQMALVASARALILANGLGVGDLLKQVNCDMYLRPVRGQISTFQIKKASPLAAFLPTITLRGDGYCLPVQASGTDFWLWKVGSSYDEDETEKRVRVESHLENSIKAFNLIGCDHSLIDEMVATDAYVGIRCASKDRLPLIGPIPNQEGLFIATAYGSRGVLWSALGANLIGAYLDAFFAGTARLRAGFLPGATIALSSELASSVVPARFLTEALATRASNSKPIFPVS